MGFNNRMPICSQYPGDRSIAKAERPGTKVIPAATVYKRDKGEGGGIIAAYNMTPQGGNHQLTARPAVLASHAIETPKILPLSELANSSDQVGRNLTDHSGSNPTMLAGQKLWWLGSGPVRQNAFLRNREGPDCSQWASRKRLVGNEAAETARRATPAATERDPAALRG